MNSSLTASTLFTVMNFYTFCALHAFASTLPGLIAPKIAPRLLFKSHIFSKTEDLLMRAFCALVVGYSILYYKIGKGEDDAAGRPALIFGKFSLFVLFSFAYYNNVVTLIAFLAGVFDALLAIYAYFLYQPSVNTIVWNGT